MPDVADLLTFDEFLRHWGMERADRLAMREEDRFWSYADLEDRTARVASFLKAAGLQKGDRICWIGKNSDIYFTLFYGAARLGIVMAPIGWRLAPPEWAYIVNDTQSKFVFTGPGFEHAQTALNGQLIHNPRFIGEQEARDIAGRAERLDFTPAGADDAVLQLYTSGTTGNPKGVELSNRNLFALRKGTADAGLAYTQWEDDEVVLVAMPCAHIGGTGLGVMALASGLPGYVLAEFTPDGLFDAIETGGVTRFFISCCSIRAAQRSISAG